MKREYTILHISDLHKPQDSNYEDLFESLCNDCEVYTSSGIMKPEIIVVSGDLVEGSRQSDICLAEKEILNQYREVRAFLEKMVGYFLDGDKRRIIIVPGNHDVFRGISDSSMVKETVKDVDDIKEKLSKLNIGNVRWNWKDLSFYSINDDKRYQSRFDLFTLFYNDFYAGVYPQRIWDSPCDVHSQLIDLPEYNICFLGLNSCYNLDHLNMSGSISPSALTSFQKQLRAISKRGSLIVGVWHHHTTGLPCEDNYLDYRILQSMIDAKVKVGLYGHQHLTSILSEYHDITRQERILLVSSGSLYGSRRQLATGVPRQYGLLSLKYSQNEVSLELHVRKDPTNYAIPSWRESQIGTSSLTVFKEDIPLSDFQLEPFISAIDNHVQNTNDYEWGYLRIHDYMEIDRSVCTVFSDNYLSKITNSDFVIGNVSNPQTDTQFECLLRAAIDKKEMSIINRLKTDERYNSIRGAMMNYLREEANKLN